MHNLLIVQGGGPTTVFNATLAAILRECERSAAHSKVFGARNGMAGLCSGEVVELSRLSRDEVSAIGSSPGATLGSSRFKPTEEDFDQACKTLRALNVQSVIFTGGNGTMRGAEIFSWFCKAQGHPIQVIGVPKTIDNDIRATDRCPGFGSAARYVAQSLIDLTMDIRSLPQPITIMETLGRDVGWIAASAALARQNEDDAPHVICLPEVPFDSNEFLSRIEAGYRKSGWAIGVVSEGTRYADGTPVFEQQVSSYGGKSNRPLIGGVAQYLSGIVTQNTGLRCRSEKPGLIGRSSTMHVSPQDRKDAEVVGCDGVLALAKGETECMVSLLPLDSSGLSETTLVPFSQVSQGSRGLPAEWVDKALGVTGACQAYMRRIAGDLQHHYRLSMD